MGVFPGAVLVRYVVLVAPSTRAEDVREVWKCSVGCVMPPIRLSGSARVELLMSRLEVTIQFFKIAAQSNGARPGSSR